MFNREGARILSNAEHSRLAIAEHLCGKDKRWILYIHRLLKNPYFTATKT